MILESLSSIAQELWVLGVVIYTLSIALFKFSATRRGVQSQFKFKVLVQVQILVQVLVQVQVQVLVKVLDQDQVLVSRFLLGP